MHTSSIFEYTLPSTHIPSVSQKKVKHTILTILIAAGRPKYSHKSRSYRTRALIHSEIPFVHSSQPLQ